MLPSVTIATVQVILEQRYKTLAGEAARHRAVAAENHRLLELHAQSSRCAHPERAPAA